MTSILSSMRSAFQECGRQLGLFVQYNKIKLIVGFSVAAGALLQTLVAPPAQITNQSFMLPELIAILAVGAYLQFIKDSMERGLWRPWMPKLPSQTLDNG